MDKSSGWIVAVLWAACACVALVGCGEEEDGGGGGGLVGGPGGGGILGGGNNGGGGILGGSNNGVGNNGTTGGGTNNGTTGPACEAPRRDCGGACVDTGSNPAHCGGCGQTCRGDEICDGGSCQGSSLGEDCSEEPCTGLTYCDLASLTCKEGCVEDRQCAGALGEASCDEPSRTCACDEDAHACSGLCVANDAPTSCGDRCEPCPGPPGGEGVADCVLGACSFNCFATGSYSCAAGCCQGTLARFETEEEDASVLTQDEEFAAAINPSGDAWILVYYLLNPIDRNEPNQRFRKLLRVEGDRMVEVWNDPSMADSTAEVDLNLPDFERGMGLLVSRTGESTVMSISREVRPEDGVGWVRKLNLTRLDGSGQVLGSYEAEVDRGTVQPIFAQDTSGDVHMLSSTSFRTPLSYIRWDASDEALAVSEELPVPEDFQNRAVNGNGLAHHDLVVAPDGTPHAAFASSTQDLGSEGGGRVYYALRSGESWALEAVDLSARAIDVGLALDGAGVPHVSYTDMDSGEVRLAVRQGRSWDVTVLVTAPAPQHIPVELVSDADAGVVAVVDFSDVLEGSHRDRGLFVFRQIGAQWRSGKADSFDMPTQPQALLDGRGHLHLVGTDFDAFVHAKWTDLDF